MLDKVGPIILDLKGTEITEEEKDILRNPLVGGVILFTRNYDNPTQLSELCLSIRNTRKLPFLIAVDQEGGGVQRFKNGFTEIPSMGKIGKLYDLNKNKALLFAKTCAWVLSSELIAAGLDISFAPVLDLKQAENPAIGERSFHENPEAVINLAKAWIEGVHEAGMSVTGKHFPGHGSVLLDSHVDLPKDTRSYNEIEKTDLKIYESLITNHLDAIMPAHIVFTSVDEYPAGFSHYWLKDVLRKRYKFNGLIFSDDLNMFGASFAGSYTDRAYSALSAGCDMVLVCNNRKAAIEVIDSLSTKHYVDEYKFNKIKIFNKLLLKDLQDQKKWVNANKNINNFLKNFKK
ncbi:beta-N-acetylhexosaminidase [Gammaproteobacteria bacterium]|nr:beta-N-acetylhexosaminidase [Gammaproteobacteria bacterium]